MEVTVAVLADAANVSQEGNLNILGIFSHIAAANFPAQHASATLVLQIRASRAEQGQHLHMTIRLMDEDEVLTEVEGELVVPTAAGPGDPILNSLLALRMLPLPKAGAYAFHILVNGTERATVPFRVVQVQVAGAE